MNVTDDRFFKLPLCDTEIFNQSPFICVSEHQDSREHVQS